MNAPMLNPTESCVALRGGVTTQMGVTGASVKMGTPIMERKEPGVQVSSQHHFQHILTQLSSSLVHLGKASG